MNRQKSIFGKDPDDKEENENVPDQDMTKIEYEMFWSFDEELDN